MFSLKPAVLTVAAVGLAGCASNSPTASIVPPSPAPAVQPAAAVPASHALLGAAGPAVTKSRPPVRVHGSDDRMPVVYTTTVVEPVARPASETVTPAKVVDWTRRGEAEWVIVERINGCSAPVELNAAEENKLRDAGVSEKVIDALKATQHRP
jgi:hypothetical protein